MKEKDRRYRAKNRSAINERRRRARAAIRSNCCGRCGAEFRRLYRQRFCPSCRISKRLESGREYHRKNRESRIDAARKYRVANRETINRQKRQKSKLPEERQKRRAWENRWRAANREKTREYARLWWARNRDRNLQKSRSYSAANRERINQGQKRRYHQSDRIRKQSQRRISKYRNAYLVLKELGIKF